MTKFLSVALLSLLLSSCVSMLVQHAYEPTDGINEVNYSETKNTKGLVLVAVTGQRTWGCGSYENAELRSLGFDLMGGVNGVASTPDLVINVSDQRFMNYAYMLDPGTYAISYINIKVANSIKDVGYITANRSSLLDDQSKPKGGTFTVVAGEAVYIGHFGIDCAHGPTLWRYYSEDRDSFDSLVASYASKYPYVYLKNISYRLFSTKNFGHNFMLP